MASEASRALSKLYDTWAATFASGPDLPTVRAMLEGWGTMSTEPEGVAYEEVMCGRVPGLWAIPKGCAQDRVLLGLHGGAFSGGSRQSHRKMFAHIAKAIGCRALIPEYRLAPEHLFPAALDDAHATYQWLLDQKFVGRHIVIAGDSAGGALTLSLQFRLRDEGKPLPAASLLISPLTDLAATGASLAANTGQDVLATVASISGTAAGYLGPDGDKYKRDPLASPLYGNFRGLSPMYIQVGGAEGLLDDSRRVADKARAAGTDCKIDIYPEMQHVFHCMVGNAPEADQAVADAAAWAKPKLALGNKR